MSIELYNHVYNLEERIVGVYKSLLQYVRRKSVMRAVRAVKPLYSSFKRRSRSRWRARRRPPSSCSSC